MKSPELKDYKSLNETREVVISVKDLPLHCPTHENALWCGHPKVFLPIETAENKTYRCPYCGTLYRLV